MTRLKGKARVRANKKKRLKQKNDFFVKRKVVLSSIRKWDDEVLTKISEKVEDWEDVSAIISELKTTLSMSKNGVGLAAVQLSHLKTIIAMMPNRVDRRITIMINPQILEKSEEMITSREGCLSYPGIFTDVERHASVKVSYIDEGKKKQEVQFRGSDAVIFQHEYEHTIGICLVGQFWKESTKSDED